MRVRRPLSIWCAAAALALVTLVAATSPAGAQSEGEVGINFVAFACPNLEAEPYGECDILTGATFEILADGVAGGGSRFPTGPTGLLPGFFFYALPTATLTITELSVDPPGNAPAPGFDPLVIAVSDIPIRSCGGESTCPTIKFINLPFAIADGPSGNEPAEAVVLPATGIGSIPAAAHQQLPPLVLLAIGMLGAGVALARRNVPGWGRIAE